MNQLVCSSGEGLCLICIKKLYDNMIKLSLYCYIYISIFIWIMLLLTKGKSPQNLQYGTH